MKEFVTNITSEESKEIEYLIEKKSSLDSLMSTLNENKEYSKLRSELLDRITNDYSKNNLEFKKWWKKIFANYGLKEVDGFAYSASYQDDSIYKINKSKAGCSEKGCC